MDMFILFNNPYGLCFIFRQYYDTDYPVKTEGSFFFIFPFKFPISTPNKGNIITYIVFL